MYVRKIKCGQFGICEGDPHGTFIQTPYDEWMWIRDRQTYCVQVEGVERRVIFCQIISYNEVTLLNRGATLPHVSRDTHVPEVEIIFGRCEASMRFLDSKHREFVNNLKFKKGDILAIKSVAGSGKTTTLLNLANIHNKKRVLYLAFNKSLIEEIKQKAPSNLHPRTFDSLLYNTITPPPRNITDIKPYNISKIVPWLSNKPWKMKQKYAYMFDAFCNQIEFETPEGFSQKKYKKVEKILKSMWRDALSRKFQTFGTIRKMCHDQHLCKDIIDEQYDMIFIDESQDFDPLMLSILLRDTSIPKIFVGDPMQSIYQWRGAINAFSNLPNHSKIIEFYTSFRIGEPACSTIRNRFDDCWMIPGNNHSTKMVNEGIPNTKYAYLFRSWKGLFETARKTKNIWINEFDKQSTYMKQLNEKLKKYDLTEEEKAQFSDDLPYFLLSLGQGELEIILKDIEDNCVPRSECICEMYTIHAYKGLEADIVKVHNDIDLEKEENIAYVALTRGKRLIIEKPEDMKATNAFEKFIIENCSFR
jgi:superfamily I DNA/RNA helicase